MKNAGSVVALNTPAVSVVGPFRAGDRVRRLHLEVNSPSSLAVGLALYAGRDPSVPALESALAAFRRLTPGVSAIEGSDPAMLGVWLASNGNDGAGASHLIPCDVVFEDVGYLYVYNSCPGSATVFVAAEGSFAPESI